MSSFFKNLANKLLPGKNPTPLHLAAFGKHPAWNDHIDDLGLETNALVNLKTTLYTKGIAENVESAAWDKLPPDQQLPGFDHAFLWYAPPNLLAGRFWSSRDGKGRDKYPMVLAVDTLGLPLPFLTNTVLKQLEQTAARCRAATLAPSVINTINHDRDLLLQTAQSLPESEDLGLTILAPEVARIAQRPEFGQDSLGFCRILYHIDRAMSAYRPPSARSTRTSTTTLGLPAQMRIPRGNLPPPEALSFWLRFLLTSLDPATQIILLAPLQQPFIDILVGEPGRAQFFSLRASPNAEPLTTDIPFTFDAGFLPAAKDFLAACRAGGNEPPTPFPPTP